MKGRIFKIKTGYNPNSSSIGVDMIAFCTAGAALTVLFNVVAAICTAQKASKYAQQKEVGEVLVRSQQEEVV